MRRAIGALALLVAVMGVLIAGLAIGLICLQRQLNDLDARVTAQETIRIEAVAPPEGGSR